VIFILTANDVHHILEPLKNRLEIINIDGYIEEEKLEIAHKYVLPQVYKECGINSDLIKFTDDALLKIVQGI
jgi:ATP-dependent Lon protease